MAYTTIDDPSQYFQTATYTGNDSSNAITNDGNSDLQPDWLWTKNSSSAADHKIFDSTRGVTKFLESNTNDAEGTQANLLSSFNSDGFTLGAGGETNSGSTNYVAWQWKANGGTTSTNSDGSENTVVQASTTSGFSIVTYSGPSGSGVDTRGHGLGAVPAVVLIKGRGGTENWVMYHHRNTSAPETDVLKLNLDNATADESGNFNDTAPTSTVFTSGDTGATNEDGNTYVAYCFAEKQGFSKFGKYKGNNNTDGTFVYTGFKPQLVIVKETGNTRNWGMADSRLQTAGNGTVTNALFPNLTASKDANERIDIYSNGFKLKTTSTTWNSNNGNYIYLAWASSPFVSSKGVPTTAR